MPLDAAQKDPPVADETVALWKRSPPLAALGLPPSAALEPYAILVGDALRGATLAPLTPLSLVGEELPGSCVRGGGGMLSGRELPPVPVATLKLPPASDGLMLLGLVYELYELPGALGKTAPPLYWRDG